ncbi:sugar ABC transporter ATP-binding protein [Brevibacillus sp. SYP-B805]|uniref:sugar ABC transporter ATP-binding protein n=1 Tax=Brevibacillus sp. SYP-B805 TaxID=1578199 RepID=UPI0013ED2F43|nr:sugar ABC transporter ATP-binding protein [Brevibacillus sp. SYP-B805]NGQ97417.1 sugar ABC transporter ATP-binding protein [Brevibacillus sp. SYP-B805]
MSAPVLDMIQIRKQYGGVDALRGVDFSVRGGEVHAILGANGAGKSTLMKILSGAEEASGGTISVNGEPVLISSPRDAKRAGIHLVQQEVDTGLVPYLSVAENICLDSQAARGNFWFSPRQNAREAARVLARCGFTLPLHEKVENLTLAEKQLVLIARAMSQEVRFVIFDEPTAPLSLTETEALFALIGHLKAAGIGIVYISHRLPEVFRIADRISVLRDGQKVLEGDTSSLRMEQVVTAMLGKSFDEEFPKETTVIGDLLYEVRDLRAGRKVKRFDVKLHAGEVVAVVGLVGAGKTEVSRLLFGADRRESGRFFLEGKEIRCQTPQEAVEQGIVLVPEERRLQGILVEESVKDNLTLADLRRYTAGGFIRAGAERSAAESLVKRLGIKTAGLWQAVGRLSGGNQQKVAIGKWLLTDAKVYLFDEPTKGVDVGAKSDIFRLINRLEAEGKGVLYFSSEIDEAMGIADRLVVMENGRLVKEWVRADWTEGGVTAETIMYYASGGGSVGSESA